MGIGCNRQSMLIARLLLLRLSVMSLSAILATKPFGFPAWIPTNHDPIFEPDKIHSHLFATSYSIITN